MGFEFLRQRVPRESQQELYKYCISRNIETVQHSFTHYLHSSPRTPVRYARRQAVSGWGGGIEMVLPTRVVKNYGYEKVDSFTITECQACCSCLKGVNIHVYESMGRYSSDFKRISCFDNPNAVANLANSVFKFHP